MPKLRAQVKMYQAGVQAATLMNKPDQKDIESNLKGLEKAFSELLGAQMGFFLSARAVFDSAKEQRLYTQLWLRRWHTRRMFKNKIKKKFQMHTQVIRYRWMNKMRRKHRRWKKHHRRGHHRWGKHRHHRRYGHHGWGKHRRHGHHGWGKRRHHRRHGYHGWGKHHRRHGWGKHRRWKKHHYWKKHRRWKKRGRWARKWRKKRMHKRRIIRMLRRNWRFHKQLSPVQKELMHLVRYEGMQSVIPARARVNLEKSVLASMMMSLTATVKGLQAQAAKVAAAKVALHQAQIKAHLRFYTNLTDVQRLKLGFMKLRKWKLHKRLGKKARRMLRKYNRLVRKKSRVYVWKMRRHKRLRFRNRRGDAPGMMPFRDRMMAPESKDKGDSAPDLIAKPPTAKDPAPKKDADKAPAKAAPEAVKKAPAKKEAKKPAAKKAAPEAAPKAAPKKAAAKPKSR